MSPRPDTRGSDSRYFFRFAGTATLLVAGTLVLVLYVLPQRYVLSSGFREGSLVLPTPSTPFQPLDARRIAALPLPVRGTGTGPGTIARGPAELFWEAILPLIRAERWPEAFALFTSYLVDHPADRDARREYAMTLHAAGYGERAVPVIEQLLASEDDPDIRLVLARVLRDIERPGAADGQYARLVALEPSEEALWLERARALAWAERYGAAEAVLLLALEVHPGSVPLRVELARAWYAMDRLEEAHGLLSDIPEAELAAAGALELRAELTRLLAPPPAPPEEAPVPLTLLEQAIAARLEGELDRAADLFAAALAERPEDPAVRQAWADFLQYERGDFEGALEALREVERLTGGDDAGMQHRLAQLELWTGDLVAAQGRLEALLVTLGAPGRTLRPDADAPRVTRPDVLTLLGDLARWDGDRLASARQYRQALAEDPAHPGATEGLRLLDADVTRLVADAERPRLGALAESFADTDDFGRVDLGGEWLDVRDRWVWGTRTGARYVEGRALTGDGSNARGLFAEVEGARWWRMGTLRTGMHANVQTIRSGEVDLGIGASVRLSGRGGSRTDLRLDHEPAFGMANTFQSVEANVRQDRLLVAHDRPLGARWVAAGTLDLASLDHRGVGGASRNTRAQASLSAGRVVSPTLTLGLTGRVLSYADASPTFAGLPLYWDPELGLSVGPYAQYRGTLARRWELDARLNPGLAWIDERRGASSELVPDLSARVGVTREGDRYRTRVELFYGQGRFTGYRSYGMNVSFGARLGGSR